MKFVQPTVRKHLLNIDGAKSVTLHLCVAALSCQKRKIFKNSQFSTDSSRKFQMKECMLIGWTARVGGFSSLTIGL